MELKPAPLRIRHAAVFLAGAVVYLLLVQGPLNWDWTPLLVGVVFAIAALVAPREGGFWPTALVLAGWGAGTLVARRTGLDVPEGAAMLTGVGLALVALELLRRRGVRADPLGAGVTVVAAGVLYLLAPHVDLLVEPAVWAFLLAAIAAANLALALSPGRGGAATPARR